MIVHLCWLLCACILPVSWQSPTQKPAASFVQWTGSESLADAIKLLNQTGNVVVDARASRGQPVTTLELKLSPGKKTFWAAFDELCAQAKLQPVHLNGRLELVNQETSVTTWLAYDGPWRARISRRTSIAYDDPALNRLLCQVELTLEPRMLPLLFTLSSTDHAGTYSFDGEPVKLLEIRMQLPPRSQTKLDQLVLEADAWLSPSRLQFSLPVKRDAADTRDATSLTIKDIQTNPGSNVWEITTILHYPAGSLEWESHQSRLLNSMKMELKRGQELHHDFGREIRTDAGRQVSTTWFFRNLPGKPADYQATLRAPAAPLNMSVKFTFRNIDLP